MALIERINITIGDITEFEGEAIVNAANTNLILGGGVAGAIRKKGGPSIQEECYKIGKIPIGEAVVTSAGNLKTKFVIHAAAMGFNEDCTKKSLENAVLNSLKRCQEKKIKRVAFPAVGMGIAGFPMENGSKILLETIFSFLSKSDFPEKVSVILYDKKSYDIFKNMFDEISKKILE